MRKELLKARALTRRFVADHSTFTRRELQAVLFGKNYDPHHILQMHYTYDRLRELQGQFGLYWEEHWERDGWEQERPLAQIWKAFVKQQHRKGICCPVPLGTGPNITWTNQPTLAERDTYLMNTRLRRPLRGIMNAIPVLEAQHLQLPSGKELKKLRYRVKSLLEYTEETEE